MRQEGPLVQVLWNYAIKGGQYDEGMWIGRWAAILVNTCKSFKQAIESRKTLSVACVVKCSSIVFLCLNGWYYSKESNPSRGKPSSK